MKRPRLLEDLGWKFFSVVVAFVLWAIVTSSQEITTAISAPIQYRNITPNLDISSEMVEGVHLHLRGPSAVLSRLKPESMPILIDLAAVNTPGERTFSIDTANVKLPAGVQLERAVPSQVRLRFEMRASRLAPVQPRMENVPTGWRVAKVECSPSTLNIIGPQSRVSRLQHVDTDAVDLGLAGADPVEMNVPAFSSDPQVSFAGSSLVRVRIQLEKIH